MGFGVPVMTVSHKMPDSNECGTTFKYMKTQKLNTGLTFCQKLKCSLYVERFTMFGLFRSQTSKSGHYSVNIML